MLLSLLCVQMSGLALGIAAGPRLGGPHAQVSFLEGADRYLYLRVWVFSRVLQGPVRGCPWDRPRGSAGVRTYSVQRAWYEHPPASFAQVRGYMEVQAGAVCKTVGSAYVGSNPTPATTCENGPLAAETHPRGRFPSCHAAYHGVSRCVDMSRCPRTYSGRRPDRSRGRGHRWLSTDGHGRARQRGRVLAQGSGSARCAARRPTSPRRGGRRSGGRRAVRQTVPSAAQGGSGPLVHWRGVSIPDGSHGT